MKLLPSIVVLFSSVLSLVAAEAELKMPEEQAAMQQIAARFNEGPVAKDAKANTELTFTGFKQKEKGGVASLIVDKASGRVVEVTANEANFADYEFKIFTAFQELRGLTLWHNQKLEGPGLKQLATLPQLTKVTLAGGSLADAGMAELAKLPGLRVLRIWHTKFSDAGVAAFRNHPALEVIEMGQMWTPLLTDKSLESLATCPKLRRLVLGETWLTWEGGLRHLAAMKQPLAELDLGNSIIEPAEFERLKAALPATKITWKGFHSGAAELQKGWIKSTAAKWIPAELLARVLAGSEAAAPAK